MIAEVVGYFADNEVAQVGVEPILQSGVIGCGELGLGAVATVDGGHTLNIRLVRIMNVPNLSGGPLGVDVYFSVGG